MRAPQPHPESEALAAPAARRPRPVPTDAGGYAVFSSGEEGAVHVMAHQMLDRGLVERGHRLLGAWLEGRRGSGSRWVHLQWHMAIFEIELGLWASALARFRRHILPAVASGEALTDAPALLWRLAISAKRKVRLPWAPVRARALRELRRSGDPFETLHHLLALAGAGDAAGIRRWMRASAGRAAGRRMGHVRRVAEALCACAAGHHREGVEALAAARPVLSRIGGSRAQRQLLEAIERDCRSKAARKPSLRLRKAAA